MRIAQEEIVGPVVSVMRCGSLDEAIAIGDNVDFSERLQRAQIDTQDL